MKKSNFLKSNKVVKWLVLILGTTLIGSAVVLSTTTNLNENKTTHVNISKHSVSLPDEIKPSTNNVIDYWVDRNTYETGQNYTINDKGEKEYQPVSISKVTYSDTFFEVAIKLPVNKQDWKKQTYTIKTEWTGGFLISGKNSYTITTNEDTQYFTIENSNIDGYDPVTDQGKAGNGDDGLLNDPVTKKFLGRDGLKTQVVIQKSIKDNILNAKIYLVVTTINRGNAEKYYWDRLWSTKVTVKDYKQSLNDLNDNDFNLGLNNTLKDLNWVSHYSTSAVDDKNWNDVQNLIKSKITDYVSIINAKQTYQKQYAIEFDKNKSDKSNVALTIYYDSLNGSDGTIISDGSYQYKTKYTLTVPVNVSESDFYFKAALWSKNILSDIEITTIPGNDLALFKDWIINEVTKQIKAQADPDTYKVNLEYKTDYEIENLDEIIQKNVDFSNPDNPILNFDSFDLSVKLNLPENYVDEIMPKTIKLINLVPKPEKPAKTFNDEETDTKPTSDEPTTTDSNETSPLEDPKGEAVTPSSTNDESTSLTPSNPTESTENTPTKPGTTEDPDVIDDKESIVPPTNGNSTNTETPATETVDTERPIDTPIINKPIDGLENKPTNPESKPNEPVPPSFNPEDTDIKNSKFMERGENIAWVSILLILLATGIGLGISFGIRSKKKKAKAEDGAEAKL